MHLSSRPIKILTGEAPLPWLLVYLAIAGIFALCFQLGDLVTTSFHGYQVWDCLFQGKIMDFYTVCATMGTDKASYDPPLYIILGLWNFPIYIINKIFGITPNPGVTTYWSRLFLLLLFAASAAVLCVIANEVNPKHKGKNQAHWLFMTVPLAVFPVIVLGCYDIIPLFFALLGIHALLQRRNTQFLLWFALANSFKYLTLFMFIPLLLASEKRIRHLLWKLPLGLSIIAVDYALCTQLTWADDRMGLNGRVADMFFAWSANIGAGRPVSIALTGYVVLCLLAAAWHAETPEQRARQLLYIPLAAYAWIFGTIPFHAQWIILIVPFMVLAIVLTSRRKTALLLAEAAVFTGFTVICWVWCHIDEQLIDICSALSYVLHLNKLYQNFPYGIGTFMAAHPIISSCLVTIFYGGLAAFVILAFPSESPHKEHLVMTASERIWRASVILAFIIPVAAGFALSYMTVCG